VKPASGQQKAASNEGEKNASGSTPYGPIDEAPRAVHEPIPDVFDALHKDPAHQLFVSVVKKVTPKIGEKILELAKEASPKVYGPAKMVIDPLTKTLQEVAQEKEQHKHDAPNTEGVVKDEYYYWRHDPTRDFLIDFGRPASRFEMRLMINLIGAVFPGVTKSAERIVEHLGGEL
jgi:hypothetical protein